MNNQMQDFARNNLKEGLALLPDSCRIIFKRLYSPIDIEVDINDVIDNIPEDKLDFAMQQVER